jgi:uncharacterized membrane protein YgdD (TMEM256/DUF423 family)
LVIFIKIFRMKGILFLSALAAGVAVILGAFGAHALTPLLDAKQAATFETGVKYQFIHSLAGLIAVLLYKQQANVWIKRAAIFFLIGIVLFSFSLYLLALKDLLGITNWKFLGPITPLGGVAFIIGWGSMMVSAFRLK